MVIRVKGFYLLLVTCVLLPAATARADAEKIQLYNSPKPPENTEPAKTDALPETTETEESKPKQAMRSMSWKPPPPEEKTSEQIKASEQEAVQKIENEKKEQKDLDLWEKYKELAAGQGKPDQENKDGDESEKGEKEDPDKEGQQEEMEKQKQEATGLRGIIDTYRDAQKGKGKLSSRSFGKID